ncbi:MAG: triosephosphate isomerase [Chloroflexi bacterium]|nr:triosephosphate isomerase [Chloroflexota bacterium]MBT4003009.1 triosephosphate isomerase [Chloroflexota bacterium]MBT4306609.1 triosephosphate isomerase [Chloroflexota bacterium]MBT4533876.1 triosephosphate isomerase [Chloroflexota bacterium]MBT4681882.1 triosephosphate isomerase [Chloroflexota bacterium]
MTEIFVNLKRFDIPKNFGGLCPLENPIQWIEDVIEKSVDLGLGEIEGLNLTYLLPEGLIASASKKLLDSPTEKTQGIQIGSQGVHWEDVSPGGNFGAYTTSLPASAAKALGSKWSIIGHSEERKAKMQIINTYPSLEQMDSEIAEKTALAIDKLVNAEVLCALNVGINVLLCVGESALERGDGDFSEQKPRIESVLRNQLMSNLKDVKQFNQKNKIVIGYEPIWAIGPGKTPPGKEYISFVSNFIQMVIQENFGFTPVVVYGGGLKEENAMMIGNINSIGGGLVALTRFTGEIGFDVPGLKGIIESYP